MATNNSFIRSACVLADQSRVSDIILVNLWEIPNLLQQVNHQ